MDNGPGLAVYSVQDLRCKLATAVLSWTVARAECDALMKLAMDPSHKQL